MIAWRPGTIGQAQGSPDAPKQAPLPAPSPAAATGTSPFQTAPAASAPAVTALRSEIAASLFRMLQGKVVGRDLLDADGHHLLAAAGTPITAELAAQAEQAGLLPEVILHMAWPPEPER